MADLRAHAALPVIFALVPAAGQAGALAAAFPDAAASPDGALRLAVPQTGKIAALSRVAAAQGDAPLHRHQGRTGLHPVVAAVHLAPAGPGLGAGRAADRRVGGGVLAQQRGQ